MSQKNAGRRLEKARTDAGLRLDDASYKVRELLGPMGCSRETIRRYEIGKVPEEKWDPIIILALAEVYGVPVIDLSNIAVAALQTASAVIVRHLDELPSRWTHALAGHGARAA